MNQLSRLILSSTIGLALTASCGASDTKGNDGAGGGGGAGTYDHTAECNRVSAEELSSALGVPGFTGPTVNPVSTSSTTAMCEYDGPTTMTYATIAYYPSVSRSTFDLGRKNTDDMYSGWDTVDAPGIGDVAFSYSIPSGSTEINTVVFLKGSTQVLVSANSTATMDQVKQLAVLVATRV